ncbi:MAG TPA: hypothetical protein V6D19_05535 [Stenomitos sp.]
MNATKKGTEFVFTDIANKQIIGSLVKELKKKGNWERLTLADRNLIENSSRAYIFSNGINMVACFPCVYINKVKYKTRVFVYVDGGEPKKFFTASELPTSKDLEKINDIVWEEESHKGYEPFCYEDETVENKVEYFRLT